MASSRKVDMEVGVRDEASKELKKIGDAAKQMGKDAEQAGRDGSRSIDEWKTKLTVLGGALGTVVSAMALAGREAYNYDQLLMTLNRRYGESTEQIVRFADTIQQTTNFTNDQALESARIFGTLIDNYGITTDEIQQLISVSADLAAATGISLEDASVRVQSAIRGETESAEYLGLALNAQTIDRQNLMQTMSNEEAAHYRLNALLEQSSYATGLAAQQQSGSVGAWKDLTAAVQDQMVAFGQWLGPVGEIASQLAPLAPLFPAIGAGIGKISAGMSELSVTSALADSSIMGVIGGAAGSAGILGLGVAAAAVTAGGVGLLISKLDHDVPMAATHATESIEDLIAAALKLGDIGDLGQDLLDLEDATKYNDAIIELSGHINELMDIGYTMQREGDKPLGDALFAGFSENAQQFIDVNKDAVISFEELDAAVNALTFNDKEWEKSANAMNQAIADSADEVKALMTIAAGTGPEADYASQALDNITDAFLAGQIPADQYEGSLQNVIKTIRQMERDSLAASDAVEQASEKMGKALDPFQIRTANHLDDMGRQMAQYAALSTKMGVPGDNGSFDVAFQNVKTGASEAAEAQAGLERGITAAANAMTYQVGESQRLAEELAHEREEVDKLSAQYEKDFNNISNQFNATGEALDTVFNAIVGNTNNIAKSAQSVMDWADELIGAAGTAAEMDDLVGKLNYSTGELLITQEDYTNAQSAYNDIARDNQRIQDDVLSIQTQMAPVIAASTEALANQMDELAGGSTDAQLFALGMMDAATSSQALALAQGYLQNQDVFGPMIQSAAELNPMLAQILEEMGLISYNPVTNEVKLIGADEAISDLDRMVQATERLAYTEILISVKYDKDEADRQFEEIFGHDVNGEQTVQVGVEVDTSGLDDVMVDLGELDGSTFTATADVSVDDALSNFDEVNVSLTGWDSSIGTADADADISAAQDNLSNVQDQLGDWDTSIGTADAEVNDNATGTISEALGLLGQLDGYNATSTITTIWQNVGQQLNPFTGSMSYLGGIAGKNVQNYASGGVVAEMNEYGIEGLSFPDGSTGYTSGVRGLYAVPKGTLVTPASHVRARGGAPTGLTVVLNVAGSIVGIDDISEAVSDNIIPAIIKAQDEWLGGFSS